MEPILEKLQNKIFNLHMELIELKTEVAELKRNQPQKVYAGVKIVPNSTSLELAFPKSNFKGGD